MIYFIKLSEQETTDLCSLAGISIENEEDYTEENVQKAIKQIIKGGKKLSDK